jgi:hypothetical protein
VRGSADAAAREQLAKVVEVLASERCTTFEECIAWARTKFQDFFHDRIAQLVYTFPEDAATSTGARGGVTWWRRGGVVVCFRGLGSAGLPGAAAGALPAGSGPPHPTPPHPTPPHPTPPHPTPPHPAGAPFWSAPKRFPHVLKFDAADPTHASLVQAGAILKAEVHGVERPAWAGDVARVAQVAGSVEVRTPAAAGLVVCPAAGPAAMPPSTAQRWARGSTLRRLPAAPPSPLPCLAARGQPAACAGGQPPPPPAPAPCRPASHPQLPSSSTHNSNNPRLRSCPSSSQGRASR